MEKNRTFSPKDVERIRIKLSWAQVEVDAAKADEFQLLIAGDDESVEDLRIEVQSGRLFVSQPQLSSAMDLPRRHWLQIYLRVPPGFAGDLDIDTVSGTVNVHGLSMGEMMLTTVAGAISIREVEASALWLHTVSGAISGSALKAKRCNLRSVSSGIDLSDAALMQTKLFTASGDIRLALAQTSQTLDGQTVSGSVCVMTDGPVRAALHSLSGQFVVTDGVPMGEGALEVTISSISGDLMIKGRKEK